MTTSPHHREPHDPEPGDLPVEPDQGPAPAGIPLGDEGEKSDDPSV